jgi:membrane-bound lytic murein transglycosylase D
MFFRLISSFVGVLVVCPPSALAIDFNIDTPAPAGATPTGPRMDRNSSIESDTGKDENDELGNAGKEDADELSAGLPDSQDGGFAPENNIMVQLPPLPDAFRPRIYETESFPVPVCLDSNVTFWKRIYRDTDVNQALVHDREDLSRIFARVDLPSSPRERKLAIAKAKDYYEQRLQRLAAKIGASTAGQALRFDPVETELLAAFRPADRNNQAIFAASTRLRFQSGLKTRFEGGVRRSLELLPSISAILESAGVPRDIVHLPHVESSYVRTARSKVGAVGLWQIMPETMRLLKGRSAVSRRMDPIISTQAAAKLLQMNYRQLGSWPLALTAYNHGTAGVSRAVRTTGSRDLCTIIERYQSRSFRFASSNFYAQFLAARHVALDKYRDLSVSSSHGRILRPLLAHAQREKTSTE